MSSLNRIVNQVSRFAGGGRGPRRPPARGHHRPPGRHHHHGGGSPGGRIGAQVGRMLERRFRRH